MTIQMNDNGFIFVSRADWGARHSAGRKKMPLGVREVNIHHTVTTTRLDPCSNMRIVEDALNGRGLAPGYSFTFDPSGTVLEGAGDMVGAHTEGHNTTSYGLSLIGNYDIQHPTLIQLVNMARMINILRMTGKLVPNLEDIVIQGHRATKATACPGSNMVQPNINGSTGIDWIRWFAATGA